MATTYAEKHGLELDTELKFHDVGVSAYRGQNKDAGRLACFREAVASGQVPEGSVLLVEQLDRISRLTPRKALRVLEDIVEGGVSVVTLNDGREYTAESLDSEPWDLLVTILTFMRANEESETKSRRLKAAWEAKRDNAPSKPLSSICPAWLNLSADRQRFEIVADRAIIVQRIFAMTLSGVGQHTIATTLNAEGVKPWGRGKFWHRSYISKILGNRAVIGTYTPHEMVFDGSSKRRQALAPILDYFPAVVTEEAFDEARPPEVTGSD